MNAAEFSALLVLATATSFTPGPNTTLSTTLAANQGLRAAMRFVVAVPVGWGLLLALCSAGVGSLVVAAPVLRWGILLGGTAYLIWLALRLWGSRQMAQTDAKRLRVGFWQGVGLQFLNIKAWMLALSIVAGWIAGRADAAERFWYVLPVLLLYAFASNLLYASVGSMLRHWLAGPLRNGMPSGQRLLMFNRLMAVALLATAAWMVLGGAGMGSVIAG